uniref:GDNF-inducible zinc finger protein 1 n=1 Tax=Rhabditophanes sp. KR3021 TaxID=114890 RepID=A0AC35TY12_9BILA
MHTRRLASSPVRYTEQSSEVEEPDRIDNDYDTVTKTVHQCEDCQKVFISYKGLLQHSVIHTDEKPFACNICQKAFRFKSNLFEHKTVHSGFTPHTCPYCGKTCRLKGNLKKHLKTHVASKQELEEAWKPFSSNRRPAQHIPCDAIIIKSTAENTYYSTSARAPRTKKVVMVGTMKDWTDKIVKGQLVPHTLNGERETKLTRFVDANMNKYVNVEDLFNAARYTSFEEYDCPGCQRTFDSRQECMEHVHVCKRLIGRTCKDRYCAKCVRMFETDKLFKAHWEAHKKVNELLESDQEQCQLIQVKACQLESYNTTSFPNYRNHLTQKEASKEIKSFETLIKAKCSTHFKLFLCSIYAPYCSKKITKAMPCRDFCLKVKEDCQDALIKNYWKWAPFLECTNFPTSGCYSHNMTYLEKMPETQETTTVSTLIKKLNCPSQMSVQSSVSYHLTLKNEKILQCSLTCNSTDDYFQSFKNKAFFHYNWMATFYLSLFFLLNCLSLTKIFFNWTHLDYPCKPFFYIAFWQMMKSLTYLVPIFIDQANACSSTSIQGNSLLTQSSDNILCFFNGIAYHYADISTNMWAIVLAVSINCPAHVVHSKTIKLYRTTVFYRFVAWFVPWMFVILIVSFNWLVDGDIYTGICSVGNLDTNNLLWFVLIPLIVMVCLEFYILWRDVNSKTKVQLNKIKNTRHQKHRIYNNQQSVISFTFFCIFFISQLTLIALNLYYYLTNDISITEWFEKEFGHEHINMLRLNNLTYTDSNNHKKLTWAIVKIICDCPLLVAIHLFYSTFATFTNYDKLALLTNPKDTFSEVGTVMTDLTNATRNTRITEHTFLNDD